MKNRKLIYGVGNKDVNYNTTKWEKVSGKWKMIWRCPYYRRWESMLKRCYSSRYQEKFPTYVGCIVCEEWLHFSKFKKWMESQDWEGKHLDKDFLVEGNKVYSPSTCTFLPGELNNFILACTKVRGECPLGVYYKKRYKGMVNELNKPYMSYIRNQTSSVIYLGYYFTPEEAHQRYLIEKLKQCEDYLTEFKSSPLILKGLTRIKNKIQYHIDTNTELTSF